MNHGRDHRDGLVVITTILSADIEFDEFDAMTDKVANRKALSNVPPTSSACCGWMEKVEGYDLSPRSPPSRRYSRRSGQDNGRWRGNMCHGSGAITVQVVLEAVCYGPKKTYFYEKCGALSGRAQRGLVGT